MTPLRTITISLPEAGASPHEIAMALQKSISDQGFDTASANSLAHLLALVNIAISFVSEPVATIQLPADRFHRA